MPSNEVIFDVSLEAGKGGGRGTEVSLYCVRCLTAPWRQTYLSRSAPMGPGRVGAADLSRREGRQDARARRPPTAHRPRGQREQTVREPPKGPVYVIIWPETGLTSTDQSIDISRKRWCRTVRVAVIQC